MTKPFLTFVTFAVLFTACKKDEFTVSEKLVDMYVDLLIAHHQNNDKADKFNQIKNSIADQHSLPYPKFSQQIKELKKHPGQWEDFFTRVKDRLNKIKTSHKGD